jgi:hypothetical protein
MLNLMISVSLQILGMPNRKIRTPVAVTLMEENNIKIYLKEINSRGNAVGIETDYGLDE